jgi:predicted RNA binding protein YcfA (HicA-like mRNA interferase family)
LPKLPRTSGPRIAAALRRLDFRDHHQEGGHLVLRHPDGRRAVVPQHGAKALKPGTLRNILREAQVDPDLFLQALRGRT